MLIIFFSGVDYGFNFLILSSCFERHCQESRPQLDDNGIPAPAADNPTNQGGVCQKSTTATPRKTTSSKRHTTQRVQMVDDRSLRAGSHYKPSHEFEYAQALRLDAYQSDVLTT